LFKHRLMLSVAVTALCAVPALATTTISTQKTEEVKTSTANSGAPDDVTIDANGSIVINAAGPALLIDLNNGRQRRQHLKQGQGMALRVLSSMQPERHRCQQRSFLRRRRHNRFLHDNGIIDLTGSGAQETGVLFKGGAKFGNDCPGDRRHRSDGELSAPDDRRQQHRRVAGGKFQACRKSQLARESR
jgi:hypothetical protein